jgi:hypothetical protein
MTKSKVQFVRPIKSEPLLVSGDSAGLDRTGDRPVGKLSGSSDLISVKSKSNAVHGEEKTLFTNATVETVSSCIALETADAAELLPTPIPEQRIEQMYELADIFASIFEALPNRVQTCRCHQRRRRPKITT